VSTDPKPSFTKTYRQADGEAVADEYGWVTDLDYFDDDEYPVELIEETWERTTVRRFWHVPTTLYTCQFGNCEEDAVAWSQGPERDWGQVCQEHLRAAEGAAK
jgi:hypothetical protein